MITVCFVPGSESMFEWAQSACLFAGGRSLLHGVVVGGLEYCSAGIASTEIEMQITQVLER